nr:MAG TPA: hypothetical protein [Caudoviricetes sp.]
MNLPHVLIEFRGSAADCPILNILIHSHLSFRIML